MSTTQTIREDIEWLQIRVPDCNTPALSVPRILLVGDSITMGYGPEVSKLLEGKASVAWLGSSRFPSDPAFSEEIQLVLRHMKFDLIHFNNGLHGFDNSDVSYAETLSQFVREIRHLSPTIRWVLANSTPKREEDHLETLHAQTERIRRRNDSMQLLADAEGIPLNDLFSTMENRPDFYISDGTHFNERGCKALAANVAAIIKETLSLA